MKQRLSGFVLGGAIAIWGGIICTQKRDPLDLFQKSSQGILLLFVGLIICGVTMAWGIAEKVISASKKPEKEAQKPPS